MAHHSLPPLSPARWSPLQGEDAARWRRVIERLDAAPCTCEQLADPHRRGATHGPILPLCEALLVAHDLFMLGHLNVAPSLRWTPADAEAALHQLNVHVTPAPATTETTEEP